MIRYDVCIQILMYKIRYCSRFSSSSSSSSTASKQASTLRLLPTLPSYRLARYLVGTAATAAVLPKCRDAGGRAGG